MRDEFAFVHFEFDIIEVFAYPVHATRVTHRNDRIRQMLGQQAEVINAAVIIQDQIGFGNSRHELVDYLLPTFCAGLPKTVSPAFTGETTTDPAPTREPFPIVIPPTIVTPAPMKTSSSISTPALITLPAPTCTKSPSFASTPITAPAFTMQ